MLADLVLSDLPTNVLIELKHAINHEILARKKKNYFAHLKRITFQDKPASETYETAIAELMTQNAVKPLALPAQARRHHFRDRMKYLPCLLTQDWSRLFPNTEESSKRYYVYAHIDPREKPTQLTALRIILKGSPFYIGKGCGNRAFDLKRNQGHAKIIANIRAAGFPDFTISQIILNDLSEREALILEAKLIYMFGSIYDETIQGCLLNLADHIKPSFQNTMQKLPSRNAWKARQDRIETLEEQLL